MCRIKIHATGDVVRLFAGVDYSSTCALVNYRVKQFVYTCICAVHQNRLVSFVLNSLLVFELYISCTCIYLYSCCTSHILVNRV